MAGRVAGRQCGIAPDSAELAELRPLGKLKKTRATGTVVDQSVVLISHAF
jgi:hypothetical protein